MPVNDTTQLTDIKGTIETHIIPYQGVFIATLNVVFMDGGITVYSTKQKAFIHPLE